MTVAFGVFHQLQDHRDVRHLVSPKSEHHLQALDVLPNLDAIKPRPPIRAKNEPIHYCV